jgi:hypothetical protein
MTATATGANARYRVKKETTFGTAATGNYYNMPFEAPVNLGSEQPLISDNLLGQGRDPLDPSYNAITVSGDVGVPIDLRYFGIWLQHLFGAPVSSDHTTYQQHIFSSGAAALPSFSHEIGHPDIAQYFMETGVMADKLALNFTRTGQAAATISLIGQKEAVAGTTGAGTPASLTLERFSQFQGAITDGGSALGAVLSATLNYSNGLDPSLVVGNSGLIDGIDPGVTSLTGTIQMRFRDMTMMNKAINGTPVDLGISYTISSVKSLTFEAPRIFLPKPKTVIQGPGGIDVTFNIQGAYDSGTAVMFKATLKNDLVGTQYA